MSANPATVNARHEAAEPPRSASGERKGRYNTADIGALKRAKDNSTNWPFLAFNWFVIIATAVLAIWGEAALRESGFGWGWSVAIAFSAVVVMGASQHQLGGAIHEATHYMLFEHRKLNELVSDWLAAFPIYTSTHHFRLHHLSHHQFVNDPAHDPNFAQAEQSGHWLDFPLTHVEMVKGLLRLLWPPNLFSYTLARARYSALGLGNNPYNDPKRPGHASTVAVGILFAAIVPAIMVAMLILELPGWITLGTLGAVWAGAVVFNLVIPDDWFPGSRVEPVISHRATGIGRISFMALIYGALTAIDVAGSGPAWGYYLLYWIVPLFTTFPVFMILREWIQHGNADRGRMTNSRVFLAGPLMRYATMPWGMDYHQPHHMFASVPHYKLKDLHELLLKDPEYAEKCMIVEGNWGPVNPKTGRPTALGVLLKAHAPKRKEAAYVDDAALEFADISDAEGLRKISEESRQARS